LSLLLQMKLQAGDLKFTPLNTQFPRFIEWNPADLLVGRIRLAGEYGIADGFALGTAVELQKQAESDWDQKTFVLTGTTTQYLWSSDMKGLFLKGEGGLFFSSFKDMPDIKDKLSYQKVSSYRDEFISGVIIGGDVGYRVPFSSRITGAASYGVRRWMPDFFQKRGMNDVPDSYLSHTNLWDVRVGVSLGITL
jgi:hypothetical protein